MSVESHCKFDKTGGIGKELGVRWFESARYGDLATLKTLHRNNPKLIPYNGVGTTYGFIGSSALHWACARGDDTMAKWLISNGASVNQQNNGGSTPLHAACANGKTPLAALLLQHGSNPTLIDCCGDTPLDVAPRNLRAQLTPLFNGYHLATKLRAVEPSKWNNRDMQALLALSGDPKAKGLVERSELQTAVQGLLAQYERNIATAEGKRVSGNSEQNPPTSPPQDGKEGDDANEQEKLLVEDVQAAAEAKEKGNEAYKAGDYKTAIRLYTLALKIVPTDAVFYSNRSACYLAINRPHLALEDGKQAVKLKPDWAKAYHRVGTAAFALGRFAEAVEAFSEGLKLQPNDKSVLEGLQKSLGALKNEEAVSAGGPTLSSASPQASSSATATPMTNSGPQESSQHKKDPIGVKSDANRDCSPPAVARTARKPWFDCVVCENKTRDHAQTPCCSKQLCGTCLRKAQNTTLKSCPFKCGGTV